MQTLVQFFFMIFTENYASLLHSLSTQKKIQATCYEYVNIK